MMDYEVEIRVLPREGILDPQGKAIHHALESLGFTALGEVHVGRLIRLQMKADGPREAEDTAVTMCRQLLANPVTEDFEVRVAEGSRSAP